MSLKEQILKLRALVSKITTDVSSSFDRTAVSYDEMYALINHGSVSIQSLMSTVISFPNKNVIMFYGENTGEDLLTGAHSHPDCYEIITPIHGSVYDMIDDSNPIYVPNNTNYITVPNQEHSIFIPAQGRILTIVLKEDAKDLINTFIEP